MSKRETSRAGRQRRRVVRPLRPMLVTAATVFTVTTLGSLILLTRDGARHAALVTGCAALAALILATPLLVSFRGVLARARDVPSDRTVADASHARWHGLMLGAAPTAFLAYGWSSSFATALFAGVAVGLDLMLWTQVSMLLRWENRHRQRVVRGFGPGLLWGEHFTTTESSQP